MKKIFRKRNTQRCTSSLSKKEGEPFFSGPSPNYFFSPVVQPNLQVSAPNDKYEQQADAMSNQVMGDVSVQRKCDDCEKEEKLQRESIISLQQKEKNSALSIDSHTESTIDSSRGNGNSLPSQTKSFMEARFGADFSSVRLHTDAQAGDLNRKLNARAFTSGNDIYFNDGEYNPDSDVGKRLLAHELTHVIQQGSQNNNVLQREDKKPQPAPADRIDVALLLDDDSRAKVEAHTYATTVIRATNSEDAKNKLKALGKPIGTLYVVSHSNRLGEVQVISASGTISWSKLSDFSKDLKGALPADKAPLLVDFRGCKLGDAPAQMETFRQNIGAHKARATNCWSFVATVTPLTIDGAELTSESQIPAGMEKQVNEALMQQINGLKSADGKSVKNCLTGLGPGESADKNFKKIRSLYFKNAGNLSAGWVSPEFNENWQEGSMCVKNMTETTSPCKIVIKEQTTP
jgi:hypothetical protein